MPYQKDFKNTRNMNYLSENGIRFCKIISCVLKQICHSSPREEN